MKKTITKISTVFLALVMLFSSVVPTTVYAAVPKKTSISSISVKDQKVTLKWKKVRNAKKYQVQYSTSSKFKGAKSTTTSGRSKTVGNLKPSKTYYFRVRGVRGNKKGKWSAKRKIKTKTAKPTTPVITGITAGSNYLTVSWSKSKRVSGYQLQYSTSNKFKNATTLNVSKKSNTRKISKLKSNQKYYARVRAYNNYQKTNYKSNWSGASNKKTNNNGGNSTSNIANVKISKIVIPNKIAIDTDGDYAVYYKGKVNKYLSYEGAGPVSFSYDGTGTWLIKPWNLFSINDKYDYSPIVCVESRNTTNEECKQFAYIYNKLNIPQTYSDIEKLMIISRFYDENYSYAYKSDGKTPDDDYYTAFHVIKYKKGICAGFSTLLYDLCYFYDIPCYCIGNKNHQWNILKLNGYWYEVDFTRPLEGIYRDTIESLPEIADKNVLLQYSAMEEAKKQYGEDYTYDQYRQIRATLEGTITDQMVQDYNENISNNGIGAYFDMEAFHISGKNERDSDSEKLYNSCLPRADDKVKKEYFPTIQKAYYVAKSHSFK